MNDNDIIKALEICTDTDNLFNCGECVFVEYKIGHKGCYAEMMPAALDLINRQKAEIERLEGILNKRCDKCPAVITAIKDFAERLKTYGRVEEDGCKTVLIAIIDNLVKEMVGDTE